MSEQTASEQSRSCHLRLLPSSLNVSPAPHHVDKMRDEMKTKQRVDVKKNILRFRETEKSPQMRCGEV